MGIGDWGLGIGPNPQSPNPQSPTNKYKQYTIIYNKPINKLKIYNYNKNYYK